MKRWIGLAAVVVAVLALAVTFGRSDVSAKGPPLGRYIVFTDGAAVNEAARQGVESHGGLTLRELPVGNGLVVLIPEHARGPIIGTPGVLAVEPDLVLTAVKKPTNPGKKPTPTPTPEPQPKEILPWGINRIAADVVWGSVTGVDVDVAVIDSGIDKDHLDLAANIGGGINFVATGKGPPWKRTVDPDAWDDDYGHGTHVAGTAAAIDNEIGVIGGSPGATLWAVKVLDNEGSGYLSDVAAGIVWAADNGIEVANLSLGIDKDLLDQYPNERQALQDAVDYAYDKGVLLVAAAGNEYPGEDTVIYPARFELVIAVSATDHLDALATFSSTGPAVELAGPGVLVYSTMNDGLYSTLSGTSMASPHVAGTAALVMEVCLADAVPCTNADVRMALSGTAEDIGLEMDEMGAGLVDAEAAVAAVTP